MYIGDSSEGSGGGPDKGGPPGITPGARWSHCAEARYRPGAVLLMTFDPHRVSPFFTFRPSSRYPARGTTVRARPVAARVWRGRSDPAGFSVSGRCAAARWLLGK